MADMNGLKKFIPIIDWLPGYSRTWLRDDFFAALTLWALLVPSVMAFAGIAGLPPEAGLYLTPLALIGYAVLGTSHHMSVGASSTMSILSFGIVSQMAVGSSTEFIALSAGLAIFTGVMLIIAGYLQLGVLADFFSRPVLEGFIVGLAITIAFGQLGKIVGYSVQADGFIREIIAFFVNIEQLHVPTLVVGVSCLAFLFLIDRYAPRIPGSLTLLVLAIVLSTLLGLEDRGVKVVGTIPEGLPPIDLPDLNTLIARIPQLVPAAIAVALVGFTESVAIARTFAIKHGYQLNANQEMLALGAANIGAGLSQGFAVNASLSRTAGAESAGAKSQMVSLITAVLVLLTLLFLTPLFYHLPSATLGAIVIHGVWRLISFGELKQYYDLNRADFRAALVAFIGVLLIGILGGLLIAVFVSMLTLIVRAKSPRTAVLGKVSEQDNLYRSLEYNPNAMTYPGLLLFRFDERLFFVNAPNFVEEIRAAVAADPSLRVVLVDAEPINSIDITALEMLEELVDELAKANVSLRFAFVKRPVYDLMQRAGLEEKIGADHLYPFLQAGVDAYLAESAKDQLVEQTAVS